MFSMLSAYAVVLFAIIQRFPASSINLIKNLDGLSLCALDRPSYSILVSEVLGVPDGVPDELRCGYQCSSDDNCAAGFNYLENGQCQFYAVPPVNCTAQMQTCKYYEVGYDVMGLSYWLQMCIL